MVIRAWTVALLCLIAGAALMGPVHAQSTATAWSEPEDITGKPHDGHDVFGLLLCDPWQNAHVLWAKNSESGASMFYRAYSGGYWSSPLDVLSLSGPVIAWPSGVVSDDGRLHLVWQSSEIAASTYYASVNLSEAQNVNTWSSPELIAEGGAGAISIAPDGTLHVFYGASSGTGLTVGLYHLWSDDNGLSWREPDEVFTDQVPFPSELSALAEFDSMGRVHVGITVRSVEYGMYSQLAYLRSPDLGHTWEPIRVIGQTTKEDTFFGLSGIAPYVTTDDQVHLTWHSPARMHQWSTDGGVTWTAPAEIMPLGAAFGGYNELAEDSAGVLHVVTAAAGGVYSSEWAGYAWTAPSRIEGRDMDPHGQGIMTCGGNELHVIYDDRHGEDSTVWWSIRYTDAPPQSREPIPTVDARTGSVSTPLAFSEELNESAASLAQSSPEPNTAHIPSAAPSTRHVSPLLLSVGVVVPIIVLAVLLIPMRRRL